jgi:hypothetical protein
LYKKKLSVHQLRDGTIGGFGRERNVNKSNSNFGGKKRKQKLFLFWREK